jgi:hypothetical protein
MNSWGSRISWRSTSHWRYRTRSRRLSTGWCLQTKEAA